MRTTKLTKEIPVWVCPTVGCLDLYPAGARDLQASLTGPMVENRAALKEATGSPDRHSRAQCPSCRARGVHVERILLTATVEIPGGLEVGDGNAVSDVPPPAPEVVPTTP